MSSIFKSGRQKYLYFIQVLAGKVPFYELQLAELGYAVVKGRQPEEPENASAIGFSDSLWDFVQLCWNGDRTQRPKVASLVAHLGEAATNWNELIPPCGPIEGVTRVTCGERPDLVENRELKISIL